ncbi:hypothetical protein HHK36_009760 [Tetracentron sinense]|uniref:Uncharacterized protein n=1 Tax=Tetracentron sinense TaxID=13715 RepID=A0A835DLW6_TETSI|nr:hypothetical protein HHK36_009760 [Tetracentron sinense]
MNVPLHSLAYALMPHYYDSKYIASPAPGGRKRSRPVDDVVVVEGVMKALETIAQDDDLFTILRDKLVFIHSNLRMLSRFNESYHEGPFKKWDIDRDEGLFDDSSVKLEELRWASLDE